MFWSSEDRVRDAAFTMLSHDKTSSLQATQKKIHGSHGEHGNFVEGDSTNRKEAVFTYGLFYNKININHCTNDINNNYNFLRCKYTNNNDMFQIF
ncbi:hypothetical protein CIK97_11665 [Prevotella sp. P3-120]|nr:hypothetical protein CIK97_11665 [Prevotella sp. P3-120]OYP53019.1 hypothetical protein CIK93_00945 [Prevotella sp. P3-92]